jgi:DNA-binding FadR family transcriptional regulator
MAASFGVNRIVVREAIKALGSNGLLKAIPGRRTFVSRPLAERVVNNLHLMFRLEVHSFDGLIFPRQLLEPEIAHVDA